MKTLILGLFVFIVVNQLAHGQEKYTLSGYITDDVGEELIGASVILRGQVRGVVSNTYGFYSITLAEGKYEFEYSYLGFKPRIIPINLNKDKSLNVALEESTEEIESVEIFAEGRDINVRDVEMSTNTLQMKTIQQLPQLLGETDIIKTIQLLPGVLQASEASGGSTCEVAAPIKT